MHRFKKILTVCLILFIAAAAGFLLWLPHQYVVPIMMYHNVNTSDVFKPNTVSPENFDRQMAYLKSHGFHVLRLGELVRLTAGGDPLPKKSVVITFDDGYEDNYTYAFKILQKYGFPATIFVISDLVNRDGHLTWEQMREMVRRDITIGSHTRFHSYLPDLPRKKQLDEIVGSKLILERHLGVPVDYFSYPIGGFSESIKQLVKKAGYRAAAATNRGYDRLNKDVFELNRIRFGDRDNRNDYLWIKLSGYYNLFRAAKKPY